MENTWEIVECWFGVVVLVIDNVTYEKEMQQVSMMKKYDL